MGLKDKIEEELVTDAESILESRIKDIKQFLEIHQDGTVLISDEYRSVSPENQILIYLIGRRYAAEADLCETEYLSTKYFYDRFEKSDRSVRNWLQALRDEGLVKKEGQSEHSIIVENIPRAIERIEADE